MRASKTFGARLPGRRLLRPPSSFLHSNLRLHGASAQRYGTLLHKRMQQKEKYIDRHRALSTKSQHHVFTWKRIREVEGIHEALGLKYGLCLALR